MKYAYSSGKSSCTKLAATLYERGILFTEKNEEAKHSRLHCDWKTKKS